MAPFIILISLALLVLFLVLYKKPVKKVILPDNFEEILAGWVSFYNLLDDGQKVLFTLKVREFLGYITIEGIDTEIDDVDRLLVASSAIIPVFHFSSYKYFNLRSVLIYPGTFNKYEFLEAGYEKNTLGMVGTGAMQGSMILSKTALRFGFTHKNQPHNTGIHEFVHLIDKEDGEVDGLPESLLTKEYRLAWLRLVDENIRKIHQGESDISHYATSSRAEFLCVVSEYFFNAPEIFKEVHPELNGIVRRMYQFPEE